MNVRLTAEPPSLAAGRRLEAAVSAHYELVWRVLRRLGVDSAATEDAAQQVLIVFSRRIADVQAGAERAFLVATATRVAADFRKKRSRAREHLDPDALAAAASHAPIADELLDRARARVLLDAVLNELDDPLRTVFVLFELEDMTMAAIAELLDVPPGTVASRLRRAREQFEASAARLTKGENER